MTLRPYQSEAHKAALDWVRRSTDPCVIDSPTGSGKSHIIAALANDLHRISGGKHVLCLAPNADLVTQNREKYLATGNPASVMSASAGGKSLKHPAVFGTPGTVINRIRAFGPHFCAVILDEAHRLTETVKSIIKQLREQNPYLRVIGLSATPHRLGEGYIYQLDESGQPVPEGQTKDPYFTQLVYRIEAQHLIDNGYLTRPVIGDIGADSYDTSGLELNSAGKFKKAGVDQAFHGHGRKTSRAIADVVAQSRGRMGVMIFAATVQHAEEIMASLPPELSRMIGGSTNTKKADRQKLVSDFKARRYKYLVSVETMTTGVDFEHVDVIAIMRATESVSLLQQIIGRGLRLHPEKQDCLVLDYAENLETHCPDGDIFNPEIKASFSSGERVYIDAECASCGLTNKFSARPNPDEFEVDRYGYFVDLAGNPIETEAGPMPAHYGRRCQGLVKSGPTYVQCSNRWTCKECPQCGDDNDIAAKYCKTCRAEIIDPNEKLRIEFKKAKKDPKRIQCDEVLAWQVGTVVTQRGNECLKVSYTTPWRTFSIWYHPHAVSGDLYARYRQFCEATQTGEVMPKTITYQKDSNSGFYKVHGYNEEADAI